MRIFAAGATSPGCLVRRVVAEREQEPAKTRMLLAHPLLTVRAPPLVLATRTRACGTAIELGRLLVGGTCLDAAFLLSSSCEALLLMRAGFQLSSKSLDLYG